MSTTAQQIVRGTWTRPLNFRTISPVCSEGPNRPSRLPTRPFRARASRYLVISFSWPNLGLASQNTKSIRESTHTMLKNCSDNKQKILVLASARSAIADALSDLIADAKLATVRFFEDECRMQRRREDYTCNVILSQTVENYLFPTHRGKPNQLS